jgi:hypothetical protein
VPGSVMTIAGGAFYDCSRLTSVAIGNNVTSIGGSAFRGCTALAGVTVPTTVKRIEDGTFSDCTGLTNVAIGNGVREIGADAFSGCTGLMSVTIPSSVTSINGAFFGCTALTNIGVDSLNPAYKSLDGVLFDHGQKTLITYPGAKPGGYALPDGVTSIGILALYGSTGLTSVTIPASVTEIGVRAFIGCASLTNFTVAPLNPSYSSLDGVLFDSDLEVLLSYPAGKVGNYTVPDGVDVIAENAFYGCNRLTSLTLPKDVSAISTFNFKVRTFYNCSSLTNIVVDPLNTNYSSVNGVLFNKTQDTLITCPGGKDGGYLVPDTVTTIEAVAFQGCRSLTNIKVGRNVGSIRQDAFTGCTALAGIYFTGDAPSLDNAPAYDDENVTIYYLPGASGWGSTFAGRPAVLWNPLIQIGDASFGVQARGFGFNIVGTTNIPVVVEVSTNLATGDWVCLQTITLTNGLASVSDPAWSDSPSRFYRLRSP